MRDREARYRATIAILIVTLKAALGGLVMLAGPAIETQFVVEW